MEKNVDKKNNLSIIKLILIILKDYSKNGRS